MSLRIEKVLFAAGEGAYYADDHDAVRAGAVRDGQAYRGSPVTPGFNSIRQPAQAMSILLQLDDGYIATGDCASVAYGGVGGREAVFQSDRAVDVAFRSLKPWIEKKRIGTFRAMADELASLKDPESGKALPLALQYGMSQALLDAVAHQSVSTMAETIASEYGVRPDWRPIPLFAQSGENRYDNVDKMLMRRVDVLPHGLMNDAARLIGSDGQLFLDYVRWVVDRVHALGGGYLPTLHFDLYGTLGVVFGRDRMGEIVALLAKAEAIASPMRLQIEAPIERSDRESQLADYTLLHRLKNDAGLRLRIVADEWCNTLDDVRRFVEAGCVDMIQIKTPDLGSITNTIEAVLHCRQANIATYLGGSCCETDRSAQVCTHIALATQPDQMLAKPGMGVDEGVATIRNEMSRALAIIRSR